VNVDIDRALMMYGFLASGGESERLLYYVHPGDPVSKHRARFGRGRVYPVAGQTEAEKTLGYALRVEAKGEAFRGNVAIGCLFYRRTRGPIDVDNLLKHVLDSATGALWQDDRQVTAVLGVLEHDPDRPRTVIIVGRHDTTMRRDDIVAGVCEICGSPFEHPGWRKNRQRFCSSACVARSRGQDLSEAVPCRQCGQHFRRHNSYQVLCGEPCRVEWLRGRNRGEGVRATCGDCGTLVPNHYAKRCRQCWIKARKAGIA
jgi:Holliday junction resolvase RusA-like endonuclease